MRIRRMTADDVDDVVAMAHLFDDAPTPAWTRAFLASERDHLLVAYADDDTPMGFVSGTELLHPDKGRSMFLNELGVDEAFRRRGAGAALTRALLDLARERGCRETWLATEDTNQAACATYTSVDGERTDGVVMFSWDHAG